MLSFYKIKKNTYIRKKMHNKFANVKNFSYLCVYYVMI